MDSDHSSPADTILWIRYWNCAVERDSAETNRNMNVFGDLVQLISSEQGSGDPMPLEVADFSQICVFCI